MSDSSEECLLALRQNNSIKSQTIDSLIRLGFDSNEALNAMNLDSDLPQIQDISRQQKESLIQALSQMRQNSKNSLEDKLNDWKKKQLISNEIKTFYSNLNQKSLFGTINERMDLLKTRFSQTEDIIEEKISQTQNESSESELKQLFECLNGLRQELIALNVLIRSIEDSNNNELSVHHLNLIRTKRSLLDENHRNIDSEEVIQSLISENTSKIPLKTCPKLSTIEKNLKSDYKTIKETNSGEKERNVCPEVVLSPKKLNSRQTTIKCISNSCEKLFKTSSRFIRHLESIHMNKKMSSDQIHGSVDQISNSREEVLKMQSFKCPFDECENSFKLKNRFKRHLEDIHIKPGLHSSQKSIKGVNNWPKVEPIVKQNPLTNHSFKCNFKDCDQKFGLIEELNEHLESVHKLSKTDSYECNYCHKLFANKSGFDRHRNLHLGFKPFHCPQNNCKSRFATNYELTRHLKSHKISTNQLI